jgi:predicted regulator of Ras-like GTPase activity (Roadblock/LC7/MglB family)
LKANNRFSGCLVVEQDGQQGKIYFREGEMIHAEQGSLSGKQAFFRMFRWPAGSFLNYPNVITTTTTITESWQFILLDAHKMLDEGEIPEEEPIRETDANSERGAEKVTVADRIKSIDGVVESVIHDRSGLPQGPVNFTQETVAAHGAYLVNFADRLGEVFGAGLLRSAALEGNDSHFLIYASKQSYLSIAVRGDRPVGEVDSAVRALLGARKGGAS